MKLKDKLLNLSQVLVQTISGKQELLTVEKRLFNLSVFIALSVSLLSIIINLNLSFDITLNLIIGTGIMVLLFIYLQSRVYNRYRVWLFIVISLIILSGSWLYNEGPKGSVNYIYILAFVVFLSITNRSNHVKVSLLVSLNLVLLYLIYFFYPFLIHSYQTPEIRESDLLLTYSYVVVFSVMIFSSLRMNYENEKQKVEIQKEKLEVQHKHITDSIIYARDIQKALLFKEERFSAYFKEWFVFWQPKDIVSGDFYVLRRMPGDSGRIFCAVGDCTGHGVPGALLTMLGMSFLNEIILQNISCSSSDILTLLMQKFRIALSQENAAIDYKDGVDAAICIIDIEKRNLEFSGVNRPVFIIRNQNLTELSPNRLPIGAELRQGEFYRTEFFDLEPDDNIYLFTDGYVDQYGEASGRKYYSRRFKDFLIKNSVLPMEKQGKLITKNFEDWKGNEEQIDDVLVVGVKVDCTVPVIKKLIAKEN